MKASELRGKSVSELQELAESWRKELFQLEMAKYTGQLDKPARIRARRRDIARALTVIRELQAAS